MGYVGNERLKNLCQKHNAESHLGLITADSSSSESLPGIEPFTNLSAYTRLSSSSAAAENG